MYRRLFGRRPQVQQQIRILTPHEKQLLITTLRHMTQPEHHITDLPLEAIGVFGGRTLRELAREASVLALQRDDEATRFILANVGGRVNIRNTEHLRRDHDRLREEATFIRDAVETIRNSALIDMTFTQYIERQDEEQRRLEREHEEHERQQRIDRGEEVAPEEPPPIETRSITILQPGGDVALGFRTADPSRPALHFEM